MVQVIANRFQWTQEKKKSNRKNNNKCSFNQFCCFHHCCNNSRSSRVWVYPILCKNEKPFNKDFWQQISCTSDCKSCRKITSKVSSLSTRHTMVSQSALNCKLPASIIYRLNDHFLAPNSREKANSRIMLFYANWLYINSRRTLSS